MSIIFTLTLRQLLRNRRRTLVTICGIVLSMAMLTAVTAFTTSFLSMLERQEIKAGGLWHAQYVDIPYKQALRLLEPQVGGDFETVYYTRSVGYAKQTLDTRVYRPYWHVLEMDVTALDNQPIELRTGEFPQAADEVLLDASVPGSGEGVLAIGQTLKLDIGQRYLIAPDHDPMITGEQPLWQDMPYQTDLNDEPLEALYGKQTRTYTIVGIADMGETVMGPGTPLIGLLDPLSLEADERVHAYVLAKKLNRSWYAMTERVAENLMISTDKIAYHEELLRYSLASDDISVHMVVYSVSGVLLAVIMLGSIALIYNAFAISVAERSRYLGMLESVGATRWQKRASVWYEGALLAAVSLPIGLVVGLGGTALLIRYVNLHLTDLFPRDAMLHLQPSVTALLMAGGASLLTIFLSLHVPAQRAAKKSAIALIRQTDEVRLTARQVEISRPFQHLLGVEAQIGLKNMRRQQGRYRATLISLVVSLILFLSVYSFADQLRQSITLLTKDVAYDLEIYLPEDGGTATHADFAALPALEAWAMVRSVELQTRVQSANWSDALQKEWASSAEDGSDDHHPYVVMLHALDDVAFDRYLTSLGVASNGWHDPLANQAVVVNQMRYRDRERGRWVEGQALEQMPDKPLQLPLGVNEGEMTIGGDEEQTLGTLIVAVLADVPPIGISRSTPDTLQVIVSDTAFEALMDAAPVDAALSVKRKVVIDSSNSALTIEQLRELPGSGEMGYSNLEQGRLADAQMLALVQVFGYGFMVLMSLIAVGNMMNTVTTSIALRRREFAALQAIGMTPAGFGKMIYSESVLYAAKAILYGLPLSTLVMYLIHLSFNSGFVYAWVLPWRIMLAASAAVLLLIGVTMWTAGTRMRKQNLVEAINREAM